MCGTTQNPTAPLAAAALRLHEDYQPHLKPRQSSLRRAARRALPGSAASAPACLACSVGRVGASGHSCALTGKQELPADSCTQPASGASCQRQGQGAAASKHNQAPGAHRVCECAQRVAHALLRQRQVAHGAPLLRHDRQGRQQAGQVMLWTCAAPRRPDRLALPLVARNLGSSPPSPPHPPPHPARSHTCQLPHVLRDEDLEAQHAGAGARHQHHVGDAGQSNQAHRQHLAAVDKVGGEASQGVWHSQPLRRTSQRIRKPAAAMQGMSSPTHLSAVSMVRSYSTADHDRAAVVKPQAHICLRVGCDMWS